MKSNSINAYRLKKASDGKVFWIFSKCDLLSALKNQCGIAKNYKNNKGRKLTASRNLLLDLDEECNTRMWSLQENKFYAMNRLLFYCATIGVVDLNRRSDLDKLVIEDIKTQPPAKVLEADMTNLWEVLLDRIFEINDYVPLQGYDAWKEVSRIVAFSRKYPQINIGIPLTKESVERELLRVKKKKEESTNSYWDSREIALTTIKNALLYERKRLERNKTRIFDYSKVKLDQDRKYPLFFVDYYPTGFYNIKANGDLGQFINPTDKNIYKTLIYQYRWLSGLKYKFEEDEMETERQSEDNYQHKVDFQRLNLNLNGEKEIIKWYSEKFMSTLNDIKSPCILAAIPSHKMTIKNIVSRIVDYCCSIDSNLINGNSFITKISNEQEAHTTPGMTNRDSSEHEKTWEPVHVPTSTELNMPVIIIDDISTSGASMNAATDYFQGLGFNNILNFVFGKSLFCKSIIDINRQSMNYDGIIMDLDQTVYDTASIKDQNDVASYYFNDLMERLENSDIKVAFITQSSYKKVKSHSGNNPFLMNNLFTIDAEFRGYPYKSTVFINDSGDRIYKPSGATIREAIQEKLSGCTRILGIGNNESDILAYSRAGIATALATWGNTIKDFPTKANYRLNTEEDLWNVLEHGSGYFDLDY